MEWFAELAEQISEVTKKPISQDALFERFKEFRAECSDPILKQSYPADMRYFKRGSAPHAGTKDIILSFMDLIYPQVHVPIVTELAAFLDDGGRNAEPTEIEKVLSKERLRRFSSESPTSYWGRNQRRIAEKYTGLYGLIRVDSNRALQCDAFALVAKPDDPTVVSVYWDYDGRLRVGDLIVNTYRLSGLTVWRSTDAVIDPAPIAFLRAARGSRKAEKNPLVLGGFGVGWKDDDPLALYHCRIAAAKLEFKGKVDNDAAFSEIARSNEVRTALKRLSHYNEVEANLVPNFLNKTELGMKSTDARDALPGLSRETLRIASISRGA